MTEAIYYILSNNAAITAIVGSNIYPIRLPLNTQYPAITFQLIDDIPVNQKTGRANYFNARVQINCFAKDGPSYSGNYASILLARAVKNALERIAINTYSGIYVQNTTLLSEQDLTDDNSDYEGVFFRSLDFNICHGAN